MVAENNKRLIKSKDDTSFKNADNFKVFQHKMQHVPFLPPVALAMRLRSLFRTLLTAMAPTSTKYFRHMSSMPPVVRMTLAPDARIFWILSLVISDSLKKQVLDFVLFQ